MTLIRPFRNGDVPALAELWNRGLPADGSAAPLSHHEFDAALCCRLFFRFDDLLVAEEPGGGPIGFVHVGFGPVATEGPSHALDTTMGTVAMLVIDPRPNAEETADSLFQAAVDHLRALGATVIYAGGQAPLNPFYWGLYGGSEFSGILDADAAFQGAARRGGFLPVATTQRFELDLASIDQVPRDPRLVILKRQSEIEIDEDCRLEEWWDAIAIGSSRPIGFRLKTRKGVELARLTSWDMAGFERRDGRLRCGICKVAVPHDQRRKAHAKYLLIEAMRYLRQQAIQVVEAQTSLENTPAIGLYVSLGFKPIGSATLYRGPGSD